MKTARNSDDLSIHRGRPYYEDCEDETRVESESAFRWAMQRAGDKGEFDVQCVITK
jgi:hypothetical protein